MAAKMKTKHYYSTHNVAARVSFGTTAITTMWTESSWAFPESYSADDSWIVRSRAMADTGRQKGS